MSGNHAVETVAPGILRLIAPNAGAMTGPGTSTFIVGHNPAIVIDPAVDDAEHRAAIIDAAAGPIAEIVLTHRHPDHASGAPALASATDAPLRAWPKTAPGRFDVELIVDRPIGDGDTLTAGGVRLVAVHTPGHAVDHLCLFDPDSGVLFAGDMVMTEASVVILPPEGRMTDYFNSLDKLAAMPIQRVAPAHGAVMDQPAAVWRHAINHRRRREAQVYAKLSADRAYSGDSITESLYPWLGADLKRVARAQVEAHLIRLAELGRAVSDNGRWRRVEDG